MYHALTRLPTINASLIRLVINLSRGKVPCRNAAFEENIDLSERPALHLRQAKERPNESEPTSAGLSVSPSSLRGRPLVTSKHDLPRTRQTCPLRSTLPGS